MQLIDRADQKNLQSKFIEVDSKGSMQESPFFAKPTPKVDELRGLSGFG